MIKLNGRTFGLKMMTCWNKSNTVWDKVSADIKKEFNSKPVYNKKKQKKLKTKIQSYGDEAKDFHNKEVSKLFISNHNCLS